MLITLLYFMNNGLWKGSLLVLIISLYWKKDFRKSTPKINMLMFGLAQSSHFGLWDIIPPPKFELAFHKYYVKKNMGTHLRAKGLVGTRRGG